MSDEIIGLTREILEKCDRLLSLLPNEDDIPRASRIKPRIREARKQVEIVKEIIEK